MHKKVYLFFFLSVFFTQLYAQFKKPVEWLSGYQKSLGGEIWNYTSAYPDYAKDALLTRTTDGNKTIEWETAKAEKPQKGYYYFQWIGAHSSGSSSGDRFFDFYINGQKKLTITTLPKQQMANWSFVSADSVRITFKWVRNDGAGDAHGMVYLRVPANLVKPNEPLKLKLVGQQQNSADWMMVFKYNFDQKAKVVVYPFIDKNNKQPLAVNMLYFGQPKKIQIEVNQKLTQTFLLKDGANNFEIPVETVSNPDSLQVLIKDRKIILFNEKVAILPVVQREIDFIHHSHTDIGYSHLQPEVERIHIKNIYDALQMIDKTKNYPAEAKFKWNVESLWAVENFLKQATETDKQRFITAVKNDDICVSALYLNMLTGLSMPEETLHYTDYAQILKQKYQLPIYSAMISDVPGFSWATVTGLVKGGVKYFSSGPNYMGPNYPYLGDRVGNFVKAWGDKPVYWASPSGKEKVLFWAAGKGYSSWHGNAPGAIFENGAQKIAQYMDDLTAKKYPYEMVQWRYNVVADNGPIDSLISDFVKSWNEKYNSPKIVLTTVNELFSRFEKRYGSELYTERGDITPYWEDGAASSAAEEGNNRRNSLRLQQLTTLYSILNPAKYNENSFYEAWRDVLLFNEHTWGAHNSISDPDNSFVTEQWRIKRGFLETGNAQLKALENSLLPPTDNINNGFSVVNTLSWQRNGPVFLPASFTAQAVTDMNGKVYPLQNLSDGRKLFIAEKLSPLSVSLFRPAAAVKPMRTQLSLADSVLTNGLLTLIVDHQTGSIKNLQNIEGFSFVGQYKAQGLNSYWYVPGLDPEQAKTNAKMKKSIEEAGPYLVTLSYTSAAPGAQSIRKKISLFANDDRVFIENTIDKSKVLQKEAVYYAFPFAEPLSNFSADAGFGVVNYVKDQLPGSNFDFFNVKRWVDLKDRQKGVQWMMVEPFMVSPQMVDERLSLYDRKKWLDTATITPNWFSYVMNNYWHTNYKASQEGLAHFNFALRPHGLLKNAEQEKAAMEFNQPLILLGEATAGSAKSLFSLDNENIVVSSITPKGNNQFLVRLFNPEGNDQQVTFGWNNFKAKTIINSENNQALSINQPITLNAYELLEVLITIQ